MPERKEPPTPSEQARALAGFGLNDDEIASVLMLSKTMLLDRYELDLASGRAEAKGQMLQALFKAGLNGDAGAAKIWLENYGGLFG